MACRRGIVPGLIKEVRIRSVDNGYVVYTGDAHTCDYGNTYVFESFPAMSQWLRENMENNGSNELIKFGGTD